jgi:TRAP-type C4-dicarboxylate transport system permease small subunit
LEPSSPPEGILAALGAQFFASPFSTIQVLLALGLGAVAATLLRHLAFERLGSGRGLLATLRGIEIGILALIVLAMVLLSTAQVAFRNLAGGGILWIDPLLRYLTLWIGFLGAAVATREGRHIQMDVLGRVLPPVHRRLASRLIHLCAAATCLVLAESAYRHLSSEYLNDGREFLQIPTWALLAVIPLSLALMTYRFAGRAFFLPPEPPAA